MKYFKDIYIENRLFDHRLVKDDLIDRWPTEKGDQYPERKDYRNLMESYVFINHLIFYIFISYTLNIFKSTVKFLNSL